MFIGEQLGLVDAGQVERLRNVIQAFGLPTSTVTDVAAVRDRMKSDKKISEGRQTWVLPTRDGGVILSKDVPESLVDAAVASVLTGD